MKKLNNIKLSNMKKSQIIFLGSFLILVGVFVLSFGHLQVLKEEVYEQVRLSFLDNKTTDKVTDANDVSNVLNTNNTNSTNSTTQSTTKVPNNTFKYNYIGYLEIPRISLKRGFLDKESKYNNINYNVTVSSDAQYPDVTNGNFILIAHSGDAYISFFAYLYKLKEGDKAYVTYKNKKYTYKLVKIEEQEKVGVVAIHRPNYNINGLTLITCTKNNDTTQTIYIFELV